MVTFREISSVVLKMARDLRKRNRNDCYTKKFQYDNIVFVVNILPADDPLPNSKTFSKRTGDQVWDKSCLLD